MTFPSARPIESDGASRHLGLFLRLARRFLPTPDVGHLHIVLPSGDHIDLHGLRPGASGVMVMHRWRALWRLFRSGERGFSDGYIAGDWSTPDLMGLLDFCLGNETAFSPIADLRVARFIGRLQHRANANTKAGSRRNIAAHYDLGNDFYRLWLDSGLNYSSAIYVSDESLEAAQQKKLAHIASRLELSGGEHVLEIGCGWGAMAEHLIRSHGARVTAVTLSDEQLSFVQKRLASERADERLDVRLQDYRDISGGFDRIVSIEMFEAVGEKYWPVYFDKLASSLNDEGCAVLQIITIAPERFATYRRRPDFIQTHIFPGGMLPTVEHVEREAARAGLSTLSHETFGLSYAETLREWRSRFLASWNEIEALGFDANFKRMWEYYLAYCETGFRHAVVDVSIVKFAKAPIP